MYILLLRSLSQYKLTCSSIHILTNIFTYFRPYNMQYIYLMLPLTCMLYTGKLVVVILNINTCIWSIICGQF